MLRRMSDRPSIITVGNFDGVHAGHRALVAAARRMADNVDARVVVAAFDPHPATALAPDRAPPPLTDRDQRTAALRSAGADDVAWLEPALDGVLGLAPDAFIEQTVRDHNVVGWVEGPDFRFGHGRTGDIDTLRLAGERLGFGVGVIDPVEVVLRDKTVAPASSSLVRWLVTQGRMSDAALVLGRPFAVRGKVVRGEQRGRGLGFPTANIDAADRLLPRDGVYGGHVQLPEGRRLAAISVGTNPTFDGPARTFEAYLLDTDADLYDQTLEVAVTRWVRDQMRFDAVEPLIQQMQRDVDHVRAECDASSAV